jgi:GNAT superfamily N-acetyltransferase
MNMHRLDSEHELERLREFLSESDPRDYLLDDMEDWARDGRLWVGVEGGRWVAFGRIHDLGRGEGWVSGLRVGLSERGQGRGGQLLSGLLSDARSLGLTELRAVIEDGNQPSRRLFDRHGFRPVFEMALRHAVAISGGAGALRPARPGDRLAGPVGWVPALSGRVDLLPGSEGGRFGRWDPAILGRWITEGKLYLGPGLAAAVQVDWLREPRTMWVNPLQGEPVSLFPAVASLAKTLGQEEWQTFLPSSERLRQVYADLGLSPHASWGDRIHLYERTETPSSSP